VGRAVPQYLRLPATDDAVTVLHVDPFIFREGEAREEEGVCSFFATSLFIPLL
jgi:hypothetical protein